MMGYEMMNWMMGSMWGFGFFGLLIEILVVIVLVLLAIYLWKQIQKK